MSGSAIKLSPLDSAMRPIIGSSQNIAKLLVPGLSLERFMMQMKVALTKTPKLLECTPASLLAACLEAADLGLDPSGRLGSAYLIPFNGKVTLVPGYRGLIDLAGRSGLVRSINAWCVHERDSWKNRAGYTPEHFPYEPKNNEDPGPWYLVWARARMAGGVFEAEVMRKAEVLTIRNRSPNGNSATSPWKSDEEEMARKTVIRRLMKKLPLSPTANWDKLSRALDMGDHGAVIEGDFAHRDIQTVDFDEVAVDPETGEVKEPPPQKSQADDVKSKL